MRVSLLSLFFIGIAAPAWSLNMGAPGDSLTDEYPGYPAPITAGVTDFAAMNWVQLLAATRAGPLNFGALPGLRTSRRSPQPA